jgi:putative transposase
MHKSTFYRVLKRWIEEGEQGLEDKPHGRSSGVRKVDLKAIEAIRRLQQNPHLGAFRMHAALAQMGIHLSPATCGRILALNRRIYGLDKPRGPSQEKREMPFASSRRHEYWTTEVRYVEHRLGGNIYVISVLENHSRAILASGIFRSQDLPSYLSLSFTRRWSATALPKPSSPTAGPSSGPTRHSRSTKP